jgi:hypothetical protein
MKPYGLICNDSIELVGHSLFNNFRLALYNLLEESNFIDIKSLNDLENITHLFIIDEHFAPNVNIWKNINFQSYINNKNIRVIVFNFEKIFNSSFPWNVDHQLNIQKFNNFFQLVSDVEDSKILKTNILNKQYLSKNTKFNILPKQDKIDKILFIGQLDGIQYKNRQDILNYLINNGLNIDIVKTNRKLSYFDFLCKINEYKYILNPLGTGKFINLRHFEALYFNTIPIQQVDEQMIPVNLNILNNCIYFTNLENFKNKISDFIFNNNKYFLEDYFKDINFLNYL